MLDKARRSLYLLRRDIKGQLETAWYTLHGYYNSPLSISFCTTTKDRFEHLEKTLPRNIMDNEAYTNCEFVLLNYSCPDPRTEEWVRTELAPYIESGRLRYFYYPEGEKYVHPHAINLAFRQARNDIVCSINADNYIGPGFAAYVSAAFHQKNIFLRGPADGRGLGGRMCVRRQDWESVSGYDERLTEWGGDDFDFAARLGMLELRQKTILCERFCKTIPHSDEMRTRYTTSGKGAGLSHNVNIYHENVRVGRIAPNGDSFGQGRVQRNFSEWLE